MNIPMTGHGAKFPRKMERAIAVLLLKRNMEEAALEAGVSKKSLQRWKKLPEFQAAYHQAHLQQRAEVRRQSNVLLLQAVVPATVTVVKVMVDPQTPTQSRLRAAGMVLELEEKGFELEDIEARLTRLEKEAA
jgi:hypothetical protein